MGSGISAQTIASMASFVLGWDWPQAYPLPSKLFLLQQKNINWVLLIELKLSVLFLVINVDDSRSCLLAVIYSQAPKGPRSALTQFALHKQIPRSLSQNHNLLLKLASTPKVRIDISPSSLWSASSFNLPATNGTFLAPREHSELTFRSSEQRLKSYYRIDRIESRQLTFILRKIGFCVPCIMGKSIYIIMIRNYC